MMDRDTESTMMGNWLKMSLRNLNIDLGQWIGELLLVRTKQTTISNVLAHLKWSNCCSSTDFYMKQKLQY